MGIFGVHMLLYTSEPVKVREILRDVLGWTHVDAGDGWLIFRTPPGEMGVHPAEGPTYEGGTRHLISFMCDDLEKTMSDLRARGIVFAGEPQDEGYGITVQMLLPGDCEVTLYEPRHPMAIPA